LGENSRFARLAHLLPGSSVDEQRELVLTNLDASKSHVASFIADKGVDQNGLLQRIQSYIDLADNKLDYVAAALDLGTSYFEHTGIQTVARRVISRACGEI
jgi:hypothetical protein